MGLWLSSDQWALNTSPELSISLFFWEISFLSIIFKDYITVSNKWGVQKIFTLMGREKEINFEVQNGEIFKGHQWKHRS